MDITTNYDIWLRQLNEHSATVDNPYIDPQPFYEVIVNCNDVLKNFTLMYQQSKIKELEYKQRYSDIGAIRIWVYLQLGIHFGEIPYVTNPLVELREIRDQNNYPKLQLPQLIDSLVAFAETLPFTEDYPAGTTLQTVVDGYSTSKFFINKNILLGDLYLWDGQYDKAAERFKRVLDINGPSGVGEGFYNQYKVSSFSNSGIGYTRILDFSSLVYTPGWRHLFERPQSDNEYNWEWIWTLPFDRNYEPQNPFIDLFSNSGGSYLVRPSQQAIDYWNSQTQIYVFNTPNATTAAIYRDNFPFDSRANFTYRMINGEPVIMKFLYNYLGTNNLPVNVFSKQGKWFLTRAATLHLHYAEAANRAGKHRLAYALTNRGIKDTYDPLPGATQGRDVSNFHQTFLPPPYDFDARLGDAPAYRASWYRNQGIRGRAALKAKVLPATDSVNNVEAMIIEENALELAYEGQRWSDLLRVAIRRNDPSFLADKVYGKLTKSGFSAGAAAQARGKLSARNWFLPFKWQ
jgi:tetratricopeptide (TPR) repeat protein